MNARIRSRSSETRGLSSKSTVPSLREYGLTVMVTRRRIGLLVAAALVVSASPASAAGPKLTVPKADLARRFTARSTRRTRPGRRSCSSPGPGDRRPGLPDRPGRVRGLRPSGLLRELPGLHDRRHPGLGPVPRLRPAARVRDGRPQGRGVRHQPGRPAAALRAHLLARPATQGHRRARRRRDPARHDGRSGGCSADDPCTPADWQQAARLESARGAQRQPDETPATSPTPPSARSPTRPCSRRAAGTRPRRSTARRTS